MRLKVIIFAIFTITLFALGVLITTLFNTTPTSNDVITMFYIAAFLTLAGLLFFALYVLKYLRAAGSVGTSGVLSNLRTALVLAVFSVLVMVMQSQSLLNWATAAVLIVAAIISELMLKKRILR